jgi:parallel beta-helix repeat protein
MREMIKKSTVTLLVLVLTLAHAAPRYAYAAPPQTAKTRVVDYARDASGNPLTGKVTFVMTQKAADGGDGLIIASPTVSAVLDSTGKFDVYLYPSASLSPVTYYQVYVTSGAGSQTFLGVYNIPVSGSIVTLGPNKVTNAALAAQYTFASQAAVVALSGTISSATFASLLSTSTDTKLQKYDFPNHRLADSAVSESSTAVNSTKKIVAPSFEGNGAALTGVVAVGAGTGSASPGGLSFIANSDGSGADGRIALSNGSPAVDRLVVNNDGSVSVIGDLAVGGNLLVTGTSPNGLYTNVKQAPYNAAGNGTTNDTSAIQSAINAACTAGGGAIFFPPGTYKVTVTSGKALDLQCSNVTLLGIKGTVRIANASATGDTIVVGTAGTLAADDCKIEGLLFQPSVTRTSGSEIYAPAFRNLTLRHVKLKGVSTGLYLGSVPGSVHIQMDDVWAEDFTTFAYFVHVIQGTMTAVNTWGRRANSVNLHIDGYCEGLVFVGGLFFNDYSSTPSNSYNLVTAIDVVSRPSQFNEFIGCYFDFGNYALVATNAFSYSFTDCWFKGRTADGVLLQSTAHDFSFEGCQFFNSAAGGIFIDGSSGHRLIGNEFINNGTAVSNSPGIRVGSGSAGIIITGNRIGLSGAPRISDGGAGSQNYGVQIDAGPRASS